ncbi:MAG: hypothetical protein KAI70_04975 [Candidatus Omnitrophica bacterium]|nr:hypothetical protein [Candidatus Omnitrophota bacterium]
MNIPEKLLDFARKISEDEGYDLVNISARGSRATYIEVVLDKKGGITLDECGRFNKKLSFWIEEEGLFVSGYGIDVCSPGLDRVLKSELEFKWAIGKQVEVKTCEPVDEKKTIIGKLIAKDRERGIVVEEESGNEVYITEANASKIRLKVDI